jgi:hypothetical protein
MFYLVQLWQNRIVKAYLNSNILQNLFDKIAKKCHFIGLLVDFSYMSV